MIRILTLFSLTLFFLVPAFSGTGGFVVYRKYIHDEPNFIIRKLGGHDFILRGTFEPIRDIIPPTLTRTGNLSYLVIITESGYRIPKAFEKSETQEVWDLYAALKAGKSIEVSRCYASKPANLNQKTAYAAEHPELNAGDLNRLSIQFLSCTPKDHTPLIESRSLSSRHYDLRLLGNEDLYFLTHSKFEKK